MRAKWFGTYNRTINPLPAAKNKPDEALAAKRSVGFDANFPAVVKPYNCRADDYFFTKVGLKVGYLTAALDHN